MQPSGRSSCRSGRRTREPRPRSSSCPGPRARALPTSWPPGSRPLPASPGPAPAPGPARPGAAPWDGTRTPIHPLSMESAYADPELLRDLGARGARFARDLGVDVIVGAETAGVPLAAAISLEGGLPFAFVRKPGYRGHEVDEPPVRGAEVAGRRVLLVDDAVSSGTSVERFTAALSDVG